MKILLKYFLFLFWLGCMLTCGMFLFTRGFLLNREVLHFYSACKSVSSLSFCDLMFNSSLKDINGERILECTEENVLSKQLNNKIDSSQYCYKTNIKVIVLLIDALRFDFVNYDENLSKEEVLPFRNKLTIIHELLSNEPHQSRLFKFIADPPTTTMQRLKGLTTGSLPTFIDVGSNFDTSEINEDNLIDQLVKAKKNITFMGDETLTFMYPGRFQREFPYPSFNVWDLDTVDNNVKDNLVPEIRSHEWDILIAHFLGVDHCGHRYGPFHSEMTRKLLEMNNVIKDVVAEMDNNTVLFVIGDHGMTGTGDHGGGSDEEVTSAMFVYSPKPFIENVESVREIRQIDLVPTLSSILGVPIPFSNVGSVVVNALPSFAQEPSLAHNWELVVTALWTNLKQITLYIQEYAKTQDQFSAEKLSKINNDFQNLRFQVESIGSEEDVLTFIKDSHRFMSGVREMCEEVWAQFDAFSMSRGLLVYFLIFALTFILTEGLPLYCLDVLVDNIFTHLTYAAVVLTSVSLGVLRYLDILPAMELHFYFSVCIVSICFLVILVVSDWGTICENWYNSSKQSTYLNVFCRIIMMLSVVGLFSNSYIIHESSTSSFLLMSLVLVSVLGVKSEMPKKENKSFSVHSSLKSLFFSLRGKVILLVLVLFLLIRFSLVYINCRAEQGCTVGKPVLTDSSRCLTTVVLIAVFITVARLYLRNAGNLVGFSPTVFISRYAPTAIVVATSGFWILQSLPRKTQHKLFEPWQLQILPRTAMCLLLGALVALFVRPLSVYHLSRSNDSLLPYDNIIPALFNQLKEVMLRRTGSSDVKGYPVVFGLATVYSATFINLSIFLTLLAVLLLDSNQALAAVLLTLSLWLLATITSVCRLFKGEMREVPWWGSVAWGLSCLHFFYATGHQASFSSIDWKTAFLLSSGSTLTSYTVPAALVIGNVFSSYILHAALLPLLIIVPHTISTFSSLSAKLTSGFADVKRAELTLFERDAHMNRAMFKLSLQYMLFFATRVFGCMLSATIHARHLMVWSIFAPKLIFEGIGFIISLPFILVGFFMLQRITTSLDYLLQTIQR